MGNVLKRWAKWVWLVVWGVPFVLWILGSCIGVAVIFVLSVLRWAIQGAEGLIADLFAALLAGLHATRPRFDR